MRWGILLGLLISVALSSPGSAETVATVQPIEGTLSINRGEGFVQVATSMEAPTGSQVMANPNSSGKVVYPDGCEIAINPGLLYYIQEKSPCDTGLVWAPGAYVVGGLLVAGGVVAIVALTGGDSGGKKREGDKSASP